MGNGILDNRVQISTQPDSPGNFAQAKYDSEMRQIPGARNKQGRTAIRQLRKCQLEYLFNIARVCDKKSLVDDKAVLAIKIIKNCCMS